MTSAPTLPTGASAGETAIAQLHAARELIAAAGSGLVSVTSNELTDLAIAAAGVVAAAEAARAGVVLEASTRGVMASSDYPRTRAWVEETCREADVPVTSGAAKDLQDVTTVCVGFDVTPLRDAVTTGELSVEAAATAAGIFRRLKNQVHCENWDAFARDLITWIGLGPSKKDIVTFEERIIGQYGTGPEPLEQEHVEKYYRRGFTQFRTTRDGMRTATVKLDPANEEVFSAALHALSKPRPDEDGTLDMRSDAQRRADALVTMGTHATKPDVGTPGTGSKARVTVTIAYGDLLRDVHADAADARDTESTCCEGAGNDATSSAAGAAFEIRTDTNSANQGRGYATTGFGTVISPTEARLLACDAQIIPIVLGTQGEILDQGRAHRTVTPAQIAALHVRDGGCSFPGCSMPPTWCDAHHLVHWINGGSSDMCNLALLCRHHHTVVHRHDLTAVVTDAGVRWQRSNGDPIIRPRWG